MLDINDYFARPDAVSFLNINAQMTTQISEKLQYKRRKYELFETPLESYLSQLERPVHFEGGFSACWRGYVGTWRIVRGKLYLVDIAEPIAGYGGKKLDDLFPASSGPVFAKWYSGVLRCPLGSPTQVFHGGFGATYSKYLEIEIYKGVFIEERVVEDNGQTF